MQGTGSYDFDWEVKAIRRAYQDYQAIRPWDEHSSAARFTDEQRWEARLKALERREQRLREVGDWKERNQTRPGEHGPASGGDR